MHSAKERGVKEGEKDKTVNNFIFVKFCEFDEIRKSLNSQLTDSKYVFVS